MRKFGKRFSLLIAGALLATTLLGGCGVQGSIADNEGSASSTGSSVEAASAAAGSEQSRS